MSHDHERNGEDSLLTEAKRTFPLVAIARGLCGVSLKATAAAHKVRSQVEWKGDKSVLARFRKPHFRFVHVLKMAQPQRRTLYFWGNDSALPLFREIALTVEK